MHNIEQFLSEFHEKDAKLVFDFFIVFSRFEYSLKRSGFVISPRGHAEPDWGKFIKSVENQFNYCLSQKTDLLEAAKYIENAPPKQQIVAGNELEWKDTSFNSRFSFAKNLSFFIRIIRNNLFHGGKFPGRFEKDVARDHQLLTNALIILNCWIELNPDVCTNFMSKIHE
ncbi:hypothetical protein GR160_16600 [Flavobacterium sp. Sd200]|uniref:hypothetical protein n=1 Tax=Flavobacterium sp. Sd200 TaxID=2692211 RepID=UPI00136A0D57|nr:hypothetical protein [Flavobacterium sp. Sd200]MXN92849.1 hypothetical protein [Flavobacterium sp. Sd200]